MALSEQGVNQAKELVGRLAGESIPNIYSSPLERAAETARYLAEARGLTLQTLDGLSEMNFGDLEGLRYEEIQSGWPDVYHSWMTKPIETEFPNGESFSVMSRRVMGTLDLLLSRHRQEPIAVVTHLGVIRLLLGRVLSIPDDHIFRIAQRHTAINRIDFFEHGPIVELING
jgi:broad specificity phosphatase PhoE